MIFYNHDIRSAGPQWLGLSKMFASRSLCLTNPQDVIQLPHNLRRPYHLIKEHYKRCGLDLTHNVIWDTRLQLIKDYKNYDFSCFFYGDVEYKNNKNQKMFKISEILNSKTQFYDLLVKLNLETPLSLTKNSNDDFKDLPKSIFPLYLKPDVSLSGIGIFRCGNLEELQNNVKKLPRNITVQLQEEIKSISFLNVQYLLEDNKIEKIAVTEQNIKGTKHDGNNYPARFNPWNETNALVKYLFKEGYRGVLGFDVAVQIIEGDIKFSILECNPRFNSSTYYILLAKKLNISQWTSYTLKTKYKSFSTIDFKDLEYNKNKKEGIIFVNWGAILHNTPQIMIAGNKEYQEKTILEINKRLENPSIKDITPTYKIEDEILLDYLEIQEATGGTWKNMDDNKFAFQNVSFVLSEISQGDLFFYTQENKTQEEASKDIYRAIEKGALGIVVKTGLVDFRNIPILEVENPTKALQDTATISSMKFDGQKVVVFGSHGKTGFKNQIKHLLENDYNIYAHKSSANLKKPVFRSLCSIKKDTQITVVEVAIPNKDIGQRRSLLIRPDFCVFTGSGPEHLSSHGNMEQLIINKSKIVKHMKTNGICIVNNDDDNAQLMKDELKKVNDKVKIYTFGKEETNDAYLIDAKFIDNSKWKIQAKILDETISYEIPLLENYAPMASISVLLLAKLLGTNLKSIANNYETFTNYFSSGNFYKLQSNSNKNFFLYDQSQRGELKGFESTIELLNRMETKGRKILITTEIINFEDNPNYKLDNDFYSNLFNESKIDILYTTGKFRTHNFDIKKNFNKNINFETEVQIYEELLEEIDEDDIIFIRGVEDGKLDYLVSRVLKSDKIKNYKKVY